MDDGMCRNCKVETEIVWDYASGDVVCTNCAFVLASHSIDDSPHDVNVDDDTTFPFPFTFTYDVRDEIPEWTFTDDDESDHDTCNDTLSVDPPDFIPPGFGPADNSLIVAGVNTFPNMLERGWRRRRYRVRRGSTPGTLYFSVLDNGIVSNDQGCIARCKSEMENFLLFDTTTSFLGIHCYRGIWFWMRRGQPSFASEP